MCPERLQLGRWKQEFRFRPLPNKADIEEVWPFLVEVFWETMPDHARKNTGYL